VGRFYGIVPHIFLFLAVTPIPGCNLPQPFNVNLDAIASGSSRLVIFHVGRLSFPFRRNISERMPMRILLLFLLRHGVGVAGSHKIILQLKKDSLHNFTFVFFILCTFPFGN
jgi:hypothetical protein